jgi:hypothetical protein
MSNTEGTPVKEVSIGGKSLGRDEITVGHEDVPVRWYRTNHPTIFCGFQINWLEGEDPETGTKFDLSSGAGLGSKYMTLKVKVPDHDTVYEYVDLTEVLEQRIVAIIKEVTGERGD